MGIKIPFPATAEKSDVDTASFAQSFMKQAAFFFGMFVLRTHAFEIFSGVNSP